MVIGEITLTDGAIAGVVTILVAVFARVVKGAAAKRETPQERATRKIMEAFAVVAERITSLEAIIGHGCSFKNGMIPEHVERFARQIVTEAENRRLKGDRR